MSKVPLKIIKKMAEEESKNRNLVRSKERQNTLGEVFTPTNLVLDILKKLPKEVWEIDKTFLDPACGNGQFLAVILIIKLQMGYDPESVLKSIYGVDIMADNVKECRKRLWDIVVENSNDNSFKRRCLNIIKKNVVCADGLAYDYSFGNKI